MPRLPNHSRAREKYIEEHTLLFNKNVADAQGILAKAIDKLIAKLTTTDGMVDNSTKNMRIVAEIDAIYLAFAASTGIILMDDFIERTDGLFDLNESYFSSASDIVGSVFDAARNFAKDSVYTAMGYSLATNSITKNGSLWNILANTSAVDKVKADLFSAIANNLLLTEVIEDIQTITTGTKDTKGSFEKHLDSTMSQPLEKFDRATGRQFSLGLELNHAFYQGGLVPASRDFCTVRNGNVYSREEISRFGTSADQYGGYTNKGAGEFQGKFNSGYNPFTDLGGYNCLHILTWISDELAYQFRPDLRPPSAT